MLVAKTPLSAVKRREAATPARVVALVRPLQHCATYMLQFCVDVAEIEAPPARPVVAPAAAAVSHPSTSFGVGSVGSSTTTVTSAGWSSFYGNPDDDSDLEDLSSDAWKAAHGVPIGPSKVPLNPLPHV